MRLDLTPGDGDVIVLTASAPGYPAASVVVDPTNAAGPVPLKEWVEDSGGTKPLEMPEEAKTDAPAD